MRPALEDRYNGGRYGVKSNVSRKALAEDVETSHRGGRDSKQKKERRHLGHTRTDFVAKNNESVSLPVFNERFISDLHDLVYKKRLHRLH